MAFCGRLSFPCNVAPLLLAALVSGCGQGGQGNAPAADTQALSGTDRLLLAAAKVALPPAGVRLEDLPDPESPGARSLQAYCTTCHALPSPAMHSATDWPSVTRRMWLRMGLLDPSYKIPVPELGDRIALLDYLTSHAIKVSSATLPDAPGRDVFQKTCNQCHELPDPRQHSAQDWVVVVRRIDGHMRDILHKELSSADTEAIVGYLSQVSK